MLEPLEYAMLTPEEMGSRSAYRKTCERAGLVKRRFGYGVLMCRDEQGKHWTLVGDPEYTRTLVAASDLSDRSLLAGLEIPEDKYPIKREGWPDEW